MNNKNIWSSEDVYIDKCGKYDNNIFDVTLSQDVFVKIDILMKKFPRLEWLAYLIGEVDYNKKTAYVNDLIIPKQEVSAAKVHDIGIIEENSIGVIHSHHSMGNFFSTDDKETINKNNDISLLVTHEKITGQIRIKTECGCYYNMEVKVHYDFKHDVDKESWLKIIDENIQERQVYIPVTKKLNEKDYYFKQDMDGGYKRIYVNKDEDGRNIPEENHLFDPREDDFDYDDLEEYNNDGSSTKVLTYEDLINSDHDSYESMNDSDLDYLFNKRYNKFSG